MVSIKFWRQRYYWVYMRTMLQASDWHRAIDWHFLGGQRFFNRYLQELLESHQWFFIVACNNSGTSLLQDMLGSTGQVSTLPHEGQRYTSTLVRATKKGYERVWSEYLADLRMTEKSPKRVVSRLVHDWMQEMQQPIKKIIIEKTTANAVRMLWLQEVFPNSYFIGLVRNGYAVTEGIQRKGHKSVERGAKHWNEVNKIMVGDSQKIKNYFQLYYEDLVGNSEQKMKDLADFVGVDYEKLKSSMRKDYGFDTIRGYQQQKVINLNSESISRLKPEDIKTIYSCASEMLDYHGYKAT